MIEIIILWIAELARNYYVINIIRRSPNHARGWALRLLAVQFIAFFKFDLAFESVDILCWTIPIPLSSINYIVGCGLFFWFPFDVALNLLRGKAWDHTGRDSQLDRVTNWSSWIWVLKIFCFLAGAYMVW